MLSLSMRHGDISVTQMAKFLIQTPNYLHNGHMGSPEPIVTDCGMVITPGMGTHVHEYYGDGTPPIDCCYLDEHIPPCKWCWRSARLAPTNTIATAIEEMRRLAEGYDMKPTKRPCERCGAEVVMTTLGFMGCEGCRFPSKHCQC